MEPGPPTTRSRPQWVLPVAAAAAVATIAVGGVTLTGGDDGGRQLEDVPVAASPSAPAPVPFTLGRLPDARATAALQECLASLARKPGGAYRISYAQRVRDESGEQGVVVAHEDATGTGLLCAEDEQAMIAGPMSKSVVVEPTTARPIQVADGGGTASVSARGTISQLSITSTFRVADTVAYVDMRVGTDAAPGAWHRAEADHGFVYASAWLDGAVPDDAKLFVETRAHDVDGKPITGGPLGRNRLQLARELITRP